MSEADRLSVLGTERGRPELGELDLLTPAALVALMCDDLRRLPDAVAGAQETVALVVEAVTERMGRGGRLIYAGAGTAGRIAVADAAEAGPTFDAPPGQVMAIIAGGPGALLQSVENAEDDRGAGAQAVIDLDICAQDSLVGVSASGRTPFVLGALEAANQAGALSVGLACNSPSALSALARMCIEVPVGPEVIAGSTRLNAGTVQKVVLNMISTAVMVGLGKTYGNLMVDLRATNTKLRHRAVRIVSEITGSGEEAAQAALEAAGWKVKVAAVMLARQTGPAEAAEALLLAQGRLRSALQQG